MNTKNYKSKPDVVANVVIHSISKNEFEIMDIDFISEEYDRLSKEFSNLQENNKEISRKLIEGLCFIDGIRDYATMDLNDYGEVSKDINKELWDKFQKEMFHTVKVELFYETTRDYWTGEVDTDVDYECELLKSSLEYEDYESESSVFRKDRKNDVPFEDMLAVYNPEGEMIRFKNISGKSDTLVPFFKKIGSHILL